MIDTPYPQLRLDVDAVDHNIRVMAGWCAAHRVALAPHVKTTMSAPVIERQMTAGAVGVTVATVDQVATVLGWGHKRVYVANEVVDRSALSRLRCWLDQDPATQISCWVDSAEGVAAAQEIFGTAARALEVLLDVGTPDGRTGTRDDREARRLAELVGSAPGIRLIGVAGFEGVVPSSRDRDTVTRVDDHCRRVRDVYIACADLFDTATPVFSMGGSAFPDRVVKFLPSDEDVPGTVRILRSGCYVTHDHGTYAEISPIRGLVAALTVRAVVLSVPEAGTAVVGAGKRDLPYDVGLPTLLSARSASGTEKPDCAGIVRTLYDHHTVLTGSTGLDVTDVVEIGISHPCAAFDRWESYLVTNGDGDEIGLWRTDFRRPSMALATGRPILAGGP